MQNFYRTQKQSNYKSLFLIGMISISVPLSLHIIFKNKANVDAQPTPTYHEPSPDPGYGYELMMRQSLDDINETIQQLIQANQQPAQVLAQQEPKPSELNITWSASPVMQAWNYNEKAGVWETVLPYKDSFRSSPTLVFGLREDGVVVWKRIKK